MKFGKGFRIHLEKTLPKWRDKFLSYKPLKKLIKNIPVVAVSNPEIQVWFVGILSKELEKFNDFYVEKEEDLIIRFQALKERVINGRTFTSETEFSEEMMEICKDFVSIHGEMVLLKTYSSLNFAGLIKILKKYDKRTGDFLSQPFTQYAFNQAFFTIAPLTNLVRECEGILEILFPLEAELVESSNTEQTPADDTNALQETKASSIYQSTIAAISAIQRLKGASSTYNPLSMAYLFGSKDYENTGDVTAENSPCNSVMGSDDEDEMEMFDEDEMEMSDEDENGDV